MFPYIGRIDFLAPDAHLLTTQTGPDVSQSWHLLSDIEMRKHFSIVNLLISIIKRPRFTQIIFLELY